MPAAVLLLRTTCMEVRNFSGHDAASLVWERSGSLLSCTHAWHRWAKDVGREAGAGKPLLKTIFQVRCQRSSAKTSAFQSKENDGCMSTFV